MREGSIALLPPQGYGNSANYSVISLAWISWKARELGLTNLRTARHGGEVKIGGHFVDGTGVNAEGLRYVLNFHGSQLPRLH